MKTTYQLILLAFISPFFALAQVTEEGPVSVEPVWSNERLAFLDTYLDSLGSAAFILASSDKTIFNWGDTTANFRAHSMRKSFLSALFGICLHQGQLDTTKTLAELKIDDHSPLRRSERDARVIDLLQSRSGIYHAAASETASMRTSRPARGSHAPGEFWYYNNWDFNALGTIFEQETGEDIFEAFAVHVAKPLGMQDFDIENCWYKREKVSLHRSYKFRISARDLARFGQLFLRNGSWNGKQLIAESWIRESTSQHSLTGQKGSKSGYGLMWWVVADMDEETRRKLPKDLYMASGTGGQRLIVIPSLQVVIVHLVNTDKRDRPRIGTSSIDRLLERILASRARD